MEHRNGRRLLRAAFPLLEPPGGEDAILLEHAASIAYYALLSFFPFLLLIFSVLGSITDNENDRLAVLTFVFRYFPTQLDFVSKQLQALSENHADVVGVRPDGVTETRLDRQGHEWRVDRSPVD